MSQKTGDMINKSGSITTGGTAQDVSALRTGREYFFIQNISSGNLWVNFGTDAVQDQPSIKIAPEASMVFEGRFCSGQRISVIGATTGQKFVAKEG